MGVFVLKGVVAPRIVDSKVASQWVVVLGGGLYSREVALRIVAPGLLSHG